MSDLNIFTPEEINDILVIIVKIAIFVFTTSVGTFTRELVFPEENTAKQNIGWSVLSGFIAFGIATVFLKDVSLACSALICFGLGFFTPSFHTWFKDKTFFKIAVRSLNRATETSQVILEEVERELDT